jgi:hypothetical protein
MTTYDRMVARSVPCGIRANLEARDAEEAS